MIKFDFTGRWGGFSKYIGVTLDGYRSGVILDGVMKFCPEPLEDNLNKCY